MRVFRIEITGEIPDGDGDMDAEAKVATKAPAQAIVDQLKAMGMTNCTQLRQTIRKKAAAVPKLAAVPKPGSAIEAA